MSEKMSIESNVWHLDPENDWIAPHVLILVIAKNMDRFDHYAPDGSGPLETIQQIVFTLREQKRVTLVPKEET